MPVLPTPERVTVGALFQSDVSHARETFGSLTKADVQAAVAAIDDWAVANASSFNAAIPLPARTALTAAQKASLFVRVIKRRYETGA